jgi:flavin reductase (DIM6/NTAB) family NADH-FMN oxidoreductase RutF
MEFDFKKTAPLHRYELLLGTVVPRPIALVISIGRSGVVNAAPYSLFNVMSHDPPIVAFSVLPNPKGALKDTGVNVLEGGEFVISLVSEELAEAMNLSCIDSPPEVSEIELTGLETVASTRVKPPRLAASPVSLECKFRTSLSFGPAQAIIFGEVELVHVADKFVLDAKSCVIDTAKLKLFGAMHAARYYARTTDLFEMTRPTWAERMQR